MLKMQQFAAAPIEMMQHPEMLAIPAKDLNNEELLAVWSVMDIIEKSLADTRKKEIRDEMFERAVRFGKKNEKGSYEWKLSDGKVTKQCRKKKPIIEPALVHSKLQDDISDLVITSTVTMPFGLFKLLKEIIEVSTECASGDSEEQAILDILESPKMGANAVVLEGLVASRIITQKQFDSVTVEQDPTWALSVVKPKDLKKVQKDIKAQLTERTERE